MSSEVESLLLKLISGRRAEQCSQRSRICRNERGIKKPESMSMNSGLQWWNHQLKTPNKSWILIMKNLERASPVFSSQLIPVCTMSPNTCPERCKSATGHPASGCQYTRMSGPSPISTGFSNDFSIQVGGWQAPKSLSELPGEMLYIPETHRMGNGFYSRVPTHFE